MLINHKKEQKIVFILLLTFFLAAVVVVFNTHNSFGGGDYFSHFRLARWGWKYPKLLFDEWGKPVFTLLVSPFAQLGINFARLYNVLAGLITALLAWKLSGRLGFSNSWLVILLVVFTPVYFISMFAVLTEVTFSALLILSLYLFFDKKYIASAVVISLLPLARTESIVLFPLFLLAFALKKQWKSFPFFLTGFFIFSLLGRPYYGNFFWLITEMPYHGGTASIYGHGNLFHFILQTNNILGYPIAGLFLVGLFTSLWIWIRKERFQLSRRFFFLLLIPGGYLLYLAAHSYVWWKGIGNSLGLIRVMAAVTPLAAITALNGFNLLIKPFLNFRKSIIAFTMLLFFWIVYQGALRYEQNFRLSPSELVLKKACHYIEENGLDKYKVYYFSNFVPFELGIDPFDSHRTQERLPQQWALSGTLADSSIIVWDAHFGPNEGKTPLDELLDDKNLQLVKAFRPEHPFKVLGGYDYVVYIFRNIRQDTVFLKDRVLDFENDNGKKSSCYSDEYAHSGRYSLKMDSSIRFSPGFQIPLKQLLQYHITAIRASVWVYPVYLLSETPVSLVVSFQHGNHPYSYHALNLNDFDGIKKVRIRHWNKVDLTCLIPSEVQKQDIVKIYIWNRSKKALYLDDLKATFY